MPWKNENQMKASDKEINLDQEIRLDHDVKLSHDVNKSGSNSIEKIVKELIKELKRHRRWSFFTRAALWSIAIAVLSAILLGQNKQITGAHTALVRLEGVIADGNDASAHNILKALKNAFKSENAKGIILNINSPGGSPVQSDVIYQEIQRLKKLYNKPLVAVIDDIGASGGYYVAVSANKIYANQSSIVGSIGVLINSFGFVDLMKKIGVERRLYTAGENKGILDEFSPIDSKDSDYVKSVIDGVHQRFIEVVRESRGNRLNETDEIYSGLFYNGSQAHELGLIDGFKTTWTIAREEFSAQNIVDYTLQPDLYERFTKQLGASLVKNVSKLFSDMQLN